MDNVALRNDPVDALTVALIAGHGRLAAAAQLGWWYRSRREQFRPTLCWRKPDSNHWSREGAWCPRVVVLVPADFSAGADATDIIRSQKLASRGDRRFESSSLQQRVNKLSVPLNTAGC